ncbi:MAG TPA: response regulator transcription factor [Candidatus Acidoferrum sp.]|nr:response regulator transcription factor [Candidatus Acidoferrum sp.]
MLSERTHPLESAITIFLLAENRLLREALIRVLSKKDDIHIVGSGSYSPQVLPQVLHAAPQVLVIDSVSRALWQNGIMRRLLDSKPQIKVLMISMEADEGVFLRMVQEGVLGYVLSDASAADVWRAIRCVAAGEAVCPPSLSSALFRFVAAQNSIAGIRLQRGQDFSPRQLQLAQLIRQGLSNKELAAQLNLSEQTVKNHVHRMLRKVGAPDRATMAELAVRSNIN